MSTQPRKPAGSPGSTGGQYDTTGRDILPSFFGAPGDDDQDRLDDQTHALAIDAVAATDDPDSYAVRNRYDGHVLVGNTRTGRLYEIITDVDDDAPAVYAVRDWGIVNHDRREQVSHGFLDPKWTGGDTMLMDDETDESLPDWIARRVTLPEDDIWDEWADREDSRIEGALIDATWTISHDGTPRNDGYGLDIFDRDETDNLRGDYVDAQIETLEDTLGPLADDEKASQQLLFSDRFDERVRVERERIEHQTGLYLRAADPSADLTNIAYAASLEDSTELKCAAIASGALKRDDLTRLADDTDPLVAGDARRALD